MTFLRPRAFIWVAMLLTLAIFYLWTFRGISDSRAIPLTSIHATSPEYVHDDSYFWRNLTTHFPPDKIRPLPSAAPSAFPKIQKKFGPESSHARSRREQRQLAVKDTFAKAWASYRELAWKDDELEPVSGGSGNPFGGWGATLVDSLDTLWIMDMRREFDEAVEAAQTIDFTKSTLDTVNVFETTIRYLGGFLSAFDLSGDARLLRKAVEVGDMIYKAFDTPNRMPITRWAIHDAMAGKRQSADGQVLVAEIGSLSMELTRLSLVTGDPKWFDAAERITDLLAAQQDSTLLPGLWPLIVDAEKEVFDRGSTFTLGAMADSMYEYLPKMSALTGGLLPVYQIMYEKSVPPAVKHNLFRPMTPTNEDILVSGSVEMRVKDFGKSSLELDPQGQHLVCFLGGHFTLGSKLFNRPQDLAIATKLVDGCIWAYKAAPRGIMPETYTMLPCSPPPSSFPDQTPSASTCQWDEHAWKQRVLQIARDRDSARDQPQLTDQTTADEIIARDRLPAGFTSIPDTRYILRPEAIESVFVLYRATGRADLVESAWDMFTAINETTSTALANSAVWDITTPRGQPVSMADSMESFWMGETLKYFYLIFSEPSLISLDEYVFNTEAHPFKRLLK